jgi:hypothetical protein
MEHGTSPAEGASPWGCDWEQHYNITGSGHIYYTTYLRELG